MSRPNRRRQSCLASPEPGAPSPCPKGQGEACLKRQSAGLFFLPSATCLALLAILLLSFESSPPPLAVPLSAAPPAAASSTPPLAAPPAAGSPRSSRSSRSPTLPSSGLSAPAAHDSRGEEILQKATETIYPLHCLWTEHLVNIKPGKPDRIFGLRIYKKGLEKGLAIFTSPASEKGKKILRVGDNLKMYFPDLGKAVRLATKDRIVGSDFTYGDTIRVHLERDYVISLAGEESVTDLSKQERKAWKLQLKAKDRSIAYDTLLYWVERGTYFPIRGEFYTISGKLLKILHYEKIRLLAGRERPTRFIMESAIETGSRTVVEILTMEEKEESPDYLFTETALSRSDL